MQPTGMSQLTERRSSSSGQSRRIGRALSSIFAVVAALSFAAGPAVAAAPPAYSDISTTVPGNVVSIGFEATGTTEFGDLIKFEGTDRARADLPITVVMSSHACQSDAQNGPVCTTTPGATFPAKLTLTLYDGTGDAIGAKILATTKTVPMRYRPSADSVNCTNGGWSSKCYSGQAVLVTFALPAGSNLPDEVVWTISFSTGDYGPDKTNGTYTPMNSLNVGADKLAGQPSHGTDVVPDDAITDTGTGVLHSDSGWIANPPLACFGLTCPGERVSGITGTPAPTSTLGTSGTNSEPSPVLPIALAFGAIGLMFAAYRRQAHQRG